MELDGKAALVTGGAHGIGEALVRAFAAEGARVVVADLDSDAAKRVAGEVDGEPLAVDVGDPIANTRMLREAELAVGPVDLLALNAGIAAGGGVEASDALWERAWRINVMAHVWAVRAWLPGAIRRGGGYVLHTASAAGLLTNLGAAPYSVTKHAVVALAEWLSITHAADNIRVSCLCPQFVETRLLSEFRADAAGQLLASQGVISPQQVAAAAVEGVREERFLILPHPEVARYEANRATDRERWLAGMRKLQRHADSLRTEEG